LRLILKITIIALLLALLLVGVFLIPPHLQVRSVEPSLPDAAQLRELMAVENGPVSIRYVNTSSQELPRGRLGHTVFLAEWADGDVFMVDAGMDRSAALEFGELMRTFVDAGEVEVRGSVAELLGEDTQRVAGVGFTHLHIDHAQGVVPFCEARGPGAKVYQTPFQAGLHNFNTEEGAALVAQSCLLSGRLTGGEVMTIDGLPGLGIVPLGGHTPGSTLFAIAADDRLWLLSGDTTNTKADLLRNSGKGFLYSYLMVPENTARTEALRLWLTALDANDDMTVIVSHDLADIEATGMAEYGSQRLSDLLGQASGAMGGTGE
jgi:glyoxylase-like metal-dependent hydrolase (beta-lactamase superfamily II)